MEVTPSLLRQVYRENVEVHQIGGETDGMQSEVAHDLGFIALDTQIELEKEVAVRNQQLPKPLTSRQQNENARRYVREHLKRTSKQVIDPHYG